MALPPAARLFQAKLRAPVDAPHAVPRRSLPSAEVAARARLVLVNGPAGFGKTTLMGQYFQALRNRSVAVCWLTLDADDNDPARFTSYLGAALARIVPALEQAQPRGPRAPGDRGAVLGEAFDLVDSLVAVEQPLAIFLDEFERVIDPEVRGIVARLLLTLGPGQQLVIGTRDVPDLGLARLRAGGQLVEVGPEQLRFSAEETRRFLAEARSLAMPPEDVEFLHARSEGWPAALQLAVLAFAGRPENAHGLRSFGGSLAEVADYLAAEVLGQLPGDLLEFLLKTSILEAFCAELCDEVTGSSGAAAMIERVAQKNLFLIALDGDRRWFRYHSLYAEFLRNRLERTRGSGLAQLHRLAAGWLARNGRHAAALEHARLAGDADLSAEILDQCATQWLHEGRVTALTRWAESIPSDRLLARPALLFIAALVNVVTHRFGEAQRLIDALDSPSAAPGPRQRELALLKFNLAIWSDRLQGLREALNQAVALLSPADGFAYASMLNCVGYLGLLECDADMARSALAAAKASPHHRDNEVVRTYSEGEAAMLHLVRGELRDASGIAGAEFDRLAAAGSRYGTSSAIVALVLADSQYERDERVAARVLLDEHLGIAEDTCIPDLIICGLIGRSRIARMEGEPRLADELVGRLQRLGESRALPRLVASALLEKSRVALLDGRRDTASAHARDAAAHSYWEVPIFRGTFGNDLHDPAIGQARLELFSGGTGAIAPLEAQILAAGEKGRLRRALKLRTLLAQAQWLSGQRKLAVRQLRQALELAAPEGLVRTLADEAWVLPDMLLEAELHGDAALGAFVRRVAAACGPSRASPGKGRNVPGAHGSLSARELEVLALLSRGLSNKEMARELSRSEATVATHLRRLYEKLGAHTRTQAIAIARRGGLID